VSATRLATLALVAAILAAAGTVAAGAGPALGQETSDEATLVYQRIEGICLALLQTSQSDPAQACDCMTPQLMRRLTPEARDILLENPDTIPVGVVLFREPSEEELAAGRACLE
jgi:hypothetical protein